MKRMRPGDVLIVVRVPHGQAAPPGFTHSDSMLSTHHGRYNTHATRLIRKEVVRVKKMKGKGKKK